MSEPQETLSCTYYAKIRKPASEVFDAVFRAENLKGYFATGLASADLEPGTTVRWGFHDFPEMEPFPVKVIAVEPNRLIHLQWGSCIDGEWNDIKFTFEPEEEPDCTKITVTESGWPSSPEGIQGCVENSGGWANMIDSLKCYVERGFNLREYMF
jgi:uncharacterized protein YndB with AHSA1/START domain